MIDGRAIDLLLLVKQCLWKQNKSSKLSRK